MNVRPAHVALSALATLALAVAATFADAARLRADRAAALAERRDLAQRYRLTDLCLFTEARYTRHPSQADLHSAFQDHPMALEHFPTGSLMPPPAALKNHENLDRTPALPD